MVKQIREQRITIKKMQNEAINEVWRIKHKNNWMAWREAIEDKRKTRERRKKIRTPERA